MLEIERADLMSQIRQVTDLLRTNAYKIDSRTDYVSVQLSLDFIESDIRMLSELVKALRSE